MKDRHGGLLVLRIIFKQEKENMIKDLFTKQQYSDIEVVNALQERQRRVEEWFYKSARRYFDDHFSQVFFDKDRKQEIFQSAFLKLWMEIDNRRILVLDGKVCRQQRNAEYSPMTCSLTTFLMAFAKNEYRELLRSTKEDNYAELFERNDGADVAMTPFDKEEDAEEQKARIVDECISELSPRCAEILTLFYYKGMSLDEIMEQRADKNTSKNGLKTAKNKCMNTLRDRISEEFRKYQLTA